MLGYDHWVMLPFPIIPPNRLPPPHPPTYCPSLLSPLLPHPSQFSLSTPPPLLIYLNKIHSLATVNTAIARASVCRYFFRSPILRIFSKYGSFPLNWLVDFDDTVNFSHKEEASEEAHST